MHLEKLWEWYRYVCVSFDIKCQCNIGCGVQWKVQQMKVVGCLTSFLGVDEMVEWSKMLLFMQKFAVVQGWYQPNVQFHHL